MKITFDYNLNFATRQTLFILKCITATSLAIIKKSTKIFAHVYNTLAIHMFILRIINSNYPDNPKFIIIS